MLEMMWACEGVTSPIAHALKMWTPIAIVSSTEGKTDEVHAMVAGSTDADRKDKANGTNTMQAYGFGYVIMLLAYGRFRSSAASP